MSSTKELGLTGTELAARSAWRLAWGNALILPSLTLTITGIVILMHFHDNGASTPIRGLLVAGTGIALMPVVSYLCNRGLRESRLLQGATNLHTMRQYDIFGGSLMMTVGILVCLAYLVQFGWMYWETIHNRWHPVGLTIELCGIGFCGLALILIQHGSRRATGTK